LILSLHKTPRRLNGHWEEAAHGIGEEVSRREVGEEGEGVYLFVLPLCNAGGKSESRERAARLWLAHVPRICVPVLLMMMLYFLRSYSNSSIHRHDVEPLIIVDSELW